jgi:plasmid maintenance system antidote protein VapI
VTRLTAAEPVRVHVRMLRTSGASWQVIAQAAGVGTMTVFDLMHRSANVSTATATALLAVNPRDLRRPRVDANGAMLRLRALQAMGHCSARVARAIGCREPTIQRITGGGATTISAELHQAIAAVFAAWWDKTPPARTRDERAAASAARKRAAENNWCHGAALDERLLDAPGYRPRTGYRPATGTGTAPDIRSNREAEAS